MSSGEPDSIRDFQVAMDYGQFYLYVAEPAEGESGEDLMLNGAVEPDGVAQSPAAVLVESPHQNNFDMSLRVEVWADRPDDDLHEWEEALEASLVIGGYGLRYSSPTLDIVDLEVPPGTYRALVTGRGFVAVGWPGSTTPGDRWRIRLWPDADIRPGSRLRSYEEPAVDVEPARYLEAGREAAARINTDLAQVAGGRALAPQTGVARASWTYRGTRRHLFRYAADLSLWTSASGNSDRKLSIGGRFSLGSNEDFVLVAPAKVQHKAHFDGLPTGPHWHPDDTTFYSLEGTWTELHPPERVTAELQWNRTVDDARGGHRGGHTVNAVLAEPTIYRAHLEQAADGGGQIKTTLSIEHSKLPVAWIDDFAAVWLCKLECGDRIFDLGGSG
jgi:hypothetical protein